MRFKCYTARIYGHFEAPNEDISGDGIELKRVSLLYSIYTYTYIRQYDGLNDIFFNSRPLLNLTVSRYIQYTYLLPYRVIVKV